MFFEQFKEQLPDADPVETEEWVDSIDAVVQRSGKTRAQYLLYKLLKRARMLHLDMPPTTQTRYINTISPEQEPVFPGDEQIERRIRRLVRWNAVAMVHRANMRFPGLGGHLSSYASAASLYEVGFNHFFKGPGAAGGGDLVSFQGHSAPGIYARAFLEGRLSAQQLDRFRREVGGDGLPSYPHPRLLPDFWQFPTVSMGLGGLNAIYRARFLRYLHHRGLRDTSEQRVWAFLGDGEMDEPESVSALSLAAREGLDNLIFVINCNLQRLDGPVRGNGKIVQELESLFRGAGWHVIKALWGREWDALLARDVDGVLVDKMNSTLDGDWQRYAVESGAYTREHFFGSDPRLAAMVQDLSDAQIQRLRRGGHDYQKIYAAYKVATEMEGKPVVIMAQTVKGWTLGGEVEGRNITHQVKKLSEQELRVFRDRLELPIADTEIAEAPYYHPGANSEEVRYMRAHRERLGGALPARPRPKRQLQAPDSNLFAEMREGSGAKIEVSTTMAFVRLLRTLLKHDGIGGHLVPIVPDEARTFGMDPLFTEFKIYNPLGQRYTPVDAEFLISYREACDGQILQEGINEAGGLASFTAAGTSDSASGVQTLPFFLFYSMFGFQRVADLIWAFADARGRGFLLGATAGRTTLNGEGLQHQDGQSLLYASTVPGCLAYDPAYAYEIAVIVERGLQRMLHEDDDIFYYLTLYNETYAMPAMPGDVGDDIVRGMYLLSPAQGPGPRVRLLGSGSIVGETLRAQDLLVQSGVAADVFSVTSYGELRFEALRWQQRRDEGSPETEDAPFVARQLRRGQGPVIAASDWIRSVPELVARWIDAPFSVLGTDGFGRSDTRAALRRYFGVDAESIALAALRAVYDAGDLNAEVIDRFQCQYLKK